MTTPETAEPRLAYAIGDVHGRDDLLGPLIDIIRRDLAIHRSKDSEPPLLILLGDYIDRGRQSPEVLDRLIALENSEEFDCHFLLGNHEAALLDFIDQKAGGRGWARFGGRATMESYRVTAPLREDEEDGWAYARQALTAAIPPLHLALLRRMKLYFQCQSLLFVHAGIRPGVALESQSKDDLLGIRSEFLEHTQPLPLFVVHGHTPVEQPDLRPNRLNLDTGAYMTGRLSAARFRGTFSAIL